MLACLLGGLLGLDFWGGGRTGLVGLGDVVSLLVFVGRSSVWEDFSWRSFGNEAGEVRWFAVTSSCLLS